MKLPVLLFCFLFLVTCHAQQTPGDPPPLDLQIDYINGVLVFKPSASCIGDTCTTNIAMLKDAIAHITVNRANKKAVNSSLPVKIGSTEFYLTIYNYPFSAVQLDTILRIENDSIIIHDVGADGILSDSTREYCINKITQKRLDWNNSYRILMQAGVCPIACFMRNLHAHGYSGYIVQVLSNGHSSIMYY